MNHIAIILAQLHGGPPPRRKRSGFPIWRLAADAAWRIAKARAADPATLPQLRCVCQLLASHDIQERERRRAYVRIVSGCTRAQARAMLDYFIPVVRRRQAEKKRAAAAG